MHYRGDGPAVPAGPCRLSVRESGTVQLRRRAQRLTHDQKRLLGRLEDVPDTQAVFREIDRIARTDLDRLGTAMRCKKTMTVDEIAVFALHNYPVPTSRSRLPNSHLHRFRLRNGRDGGTDVGHRFADGLRYRHER